MKYFQIGIIIVLLGLPQFSSASHQASFHFVPVSFSAVEGGFFKQSIVVSTSEAINAVSGKISFPNEIVEIVSIDTGSSAVDFWVSKPSFSNVSGSLTFEGVILNPGFTGSIGNIADVTYRAKKAGAGEMYFESGAALANDGKGTNILESLDRITVSVSDEGTKARLADRETFPQKFSVELIESRDLTEPVRSFRFLTDASARFDFYEIVIDDSETLIWPGDRGTTYTTPKLGPGQHSITVTAVDSLGRVRTDSEVFEIRPLDPLFLADLPAKAYLGASPWFCRVTAIFGTSSCLDDFVIEGRAFPGAEVVINLSNSVDEFAYKGLAGASGFFSIPVEGVLGRGTYEVYAQATDERGAKTDPQKVVSLTIDDAGSPSNGVSPTMLIIIAAALALAWYLYTKIISNKMKVQKEGLEARMILREGFDDISSDVSKLKEMLAAVGKGKADLTQEEKNMIDGLEKKIKEKEASIDKEIKDIDSV